MIPNELGVFKKCPGYFAILNRFLHLGLRKGIPDMLLVVNSKLVFIEFKTLSGSTSEAQKRWIESLESTGALVYVCRSSEEAIDIIEKLR
jgi:hypothetical protein